jgi:hypothetical protein
MDMPTAKSRLESLHPLLAQAHVNAAAKWRKLNEEFPEWTLPFDAGERAQQLHPHVALEVATMVEPREDANVNRGLDFFGLMVGEDVLLRFKQSGLLGPRNYQTDQQKSLAEQSYDVDMLAALGLEEPPTLLTCGYRMGSDGLALAEVVIRWDKKYHPSWEYPIYGEDASSVEPLRLGDMPPAQPARLRSKKSASDEEAKEEGGSK